MIDKPLQISDMSLSEKDILQDKDNSIINKSFYSTDFNFPDLVTKKNYLQIKLIPLEYHMQIHSKSIKKIFNLISNNDQTELEDNYLDYITCLIGEGDELDKQNLLVENDQQIMQNILDPSYYELLNKTKVFYIDIPKSNDNMNMNININNIINKKINLRKQSLEKIASFLGLNIFGMSDYIEIFILSYKEKDDDILLGERFLLRAKLMGKLSNSIEDIKLDNEFNGFKKFDIDMKEAKKCSRNKLHFMDFYFNNVWNAIEKENLNDENLSFSATPFDKNSREDINNKNNNMNNNINNNINVELPNSYNIHESKNRNENKNGEFKEDNTCAESVCANICNIF